MKEKRKIQKKNGKTYIHINYLLLNKQKKKSENY